MQYRVGDTIAYQTFGGTQRVVRVTNHEPDIGNGRPGFDGLTMPDQASVWGYDDQVVRVIPRGAKA